VLDAVALVTPVLVVADMVVTVASFEVGVLVAGKSVVVLPLMTTAVALGLRLMVIPLIVIIPPGVNVCPSMTNVVPAFAVKTVPSKVISGGFVVMPFGRLVVIPLMTIAVPLGRREMVLPM
jgi:hypothetical protein